jgi:hypothetical protein
MLFAVSAQTVAAAAPAQPPTHPPTANDPCGPARDPQEFFKCLEKALETRHVALPPPGFTNAMEKLIERFELPAQ